MQRTSTYLIITLLIVLVASTQNASANWRAGNRRSSASGVKATISTPLGAPYTPSGAGQYNWVGAVGIGWMQTGWKYNPGSGDTEPTDYIESLMGGVYSGIIPYETHCWSCSIAYRVEYAGSSTWNVYINDTFKVGRGPLSNSIEMQVLSEIWGNSGTQLNTHFSSVQYKNSSGVWKSFDQSKWIENYPYGVVDKTYKYFWHSFGPF